VTCVMLSILVASRSPINTMFSPLTKNKPNRTSLYLEWRGVVRCCRCTVLY
jgi:hypothetical protein